MNFSYKKTLSGIYLTSVILFKPIRVEAIVGGEDSSDKLAQSTVLVFTKTGYCSGVLVSVDAVMTTASCAEVATHVSGFGINGRDAKTIPIVEKFINPGYVPDAIVKRVVSIDIAILKISNSPEHNEPIPLVGYAVNVGHPVQIGGLGIRVENTSPIDTHYDNTRYGSARLKVINPESRILAWVGGRPGLGICSGDAGGPFGVDAALFAIGAWSKGINGAKCGDVSQGVLLWPQREWIDYTLSKWGVQAVWLDKPPETPAPPSVIATAAPTIAPPPEVKPAPPPPTPVVPDRRVALVIGNSAYPNAVLANPVFDADLVSGASGKWASMSWRSKTPISQSSTRL